MDRHEDLEHPLGLCKTIHLANLLPEAKDCHACKKRFCPKCSRIFKEQADKREKIVL